MQQGIVPQPSQTPPLKPPPSPTPMHWRVWLFGLVIVLAGLTYILDPWIGPRGRAMFGVPALILLTAGVSSNLRAVNWRTLIWGVILQGLLILSILQLGFRRPYSAEMTQNFELQRAVALIGTGTVPLTNAWIQTIATPESYFYRPGFELFRTLGSGVKKFLEFTEAGSRFVFGPLANPEEMNKVLPKQGFIFAFSALPTIIFVSSFFTILYHVGILPLIVRFFARGMMLLMHTSGAETLSAAANVFMGQTEAPLIVKPYILRMTSSELLALMVGGMATISGGVMAVYINMGADPVAILATSVMAAPCGLYLAKLMLPETETPQTLGNADSPVEDTHRNIIDAATAGASDGMSLALNIAAMLIAFLAILAMADALLQAIHPGLALQKIFGILFAPVAYLMGVDRQDLLAVGDLLGTKLVANEFVAYVKLTTEYRAQISPRSYALATFALTGFANFSSIGIQIGGIGAMAPSRRPELARLGMRALYVGFVTTLVNAGLAGILMDTGE